MRRPRAPDFKLPGGELPCGAQADVAHGDQLGNRTVFKRLGYLLEVLALGGPEFRDACRARISHGISLLDPSLGARGAIVTRWHLRINAEVGR